MHGMTFPIPHFPFPIVKQNCLCLIMGNGEWGMGNVVFFIKEPRLRKRL